MPMPEHARFWWQPGDCGGCYIAEAMPASVCLAWKYHEDSAAGITANAMVGGDNCHRGAVIGTLLGTVCGVPGRFRFTRDCNRPPGKEL